MTISGGSTVRMLSTRDASPTSRIACRSIHTSRATQPKLNGASSGGGGASWRASARPHRPRPSAQFGLGDGDRRVVLGKLGMADPDQVALLVVADKKRRAAVGEQHDDRAWTCRARPAASRACARPSPTVRWRGPIRPGRRPRGLHRPARASRCGRAPCRESGRQTQSPSGGPGWRPRRPGSAGPCAAAASRVTSEIMSIALLLTGQRKRCAGR